MTALIEEPAGVFAPETLHYGREILSGKRVALIGFAAAAAGELKRMVMEAEGFVRVFSLLEVQPSAPVLKPFELILVDVESAAGTDWLTPGVTSGVMSGVMDRCIAVGGLATLAALAAQAPASYREFSVSPAAAEDFLLRCALALRPPAAPAVRTLPQGSTIVLADDDSSVTSIVRLALQRNGLTCEVAFSGGSALELIQKLRPCAAVLDVNMPHIDGFEVLARIKSTPELAQTRVILLTGCEQEADILRGFSLGADDYVVKPFNPMELMMRLMRVIGRI